MTLWGASVMVGVVAAWGGGQDGPAPRQAADAPTSPEATTTTPEATAPAPTGGPPATEHREGAPPPARLPTAAVMGLNAHAGVTADTALLLSDHLTALLRKSGRFSSVVSTADIAAALTQQQRRQATDCDDASCMAEIGGALGVDELVYGHVGRVGSAWALNVRVVSTRTALASAMVSRTVSGTDESVLFPAMERALEEMWVGGPPPDGRPPALDPAAGSTPPPVASPPAAAPAPGPGPGFPAFLSLRSRHTLWLILSGLQGAAATLMAISAVALGAGCLLVLTSPRWPAGTGFLPTLLGLPSAAGALLVICLVSPAALAASLAGALTSAVLLRTRLRMVEQALLAPLTALACGTGCAAPCAVTGGCVLAYGATWSFVQRSPQSVDGARVDVTAMNLAEYAAFNAAMSVVVTALMVAVPAALAAPLLVATHLFGADWPALLGRE